MQAPANSGSNFYDYKGTFSIILLAVYDAQYCFTILDIGDTVGDSAFPLKTYVLHPFPGRFSPEDKQIFNYRLSRARQVIKNTFRIMATKFRIFRRYIVANPDKVTKINKAACCFHNYLWISEIN